MEPFALAEFVIVLAAATLILLAAARLRLPVVAGFLLTGVVIGPSGLRLVRSTPGIQLLAEIGVVMLLFTVGLEFSPRRLLQMKRPMLLGGGVQVALTTLAAALLLGRLGLPVDRCVFYGFVLSLSSTAVVLKSLADRAELDSVHGGVTLGILLFQDIAVVPMIALLPVLARAEAAPWPRVLGRFAFQLLVLTALLLAGRRLLPRLLHRVVQTRVREVFVMAALLVCLGLALLTAELGLSLALGAFLAGIILSDSPYSQQVVSDILPFKDLFNSLFFIAVGMMLDLGAVWRVRGLVVALFLAVLAGKALVAYLSVRLLRFPAAVALRAAPALAQVGEFSFLLAAAGRQLGLMSAAHQQVFIAVSILTILATPFLIAASPRLAERARGNAPVAAAAPTAGHHVIVAGYGLNGRNLARVLRQAGIAYLVLDLNPDTVRAARQEGEPILFGDVSRGDILRAAGAGSARVLVLALSDPRAARRAVKLARQLNGGLFILVRTRYVAEIDELYALGADEVIPEEFETSIEIFTRVLEEFHIPSNLIAAQVQVLRGERYGLLRGLPLKRASMERIAELLTAGTADTFLVGTGTRPVGRSLQELDLRGRTGATVVAVVRGDASFASPTAGFRIAAQDILVLVASHADMDRAFRFLGEAAE